MNIVRTSHICGNVIGGGSEAKTTFHRRNTLVAKTFHFLTCSECAQLVFGFNDI